MNMDSRDHDPTDQCGDKCSPDGSLAAMTERYRGMLELIAKQSPHQDQDATRENYLRLVLISLAKTALDAATNAEAARAADYAVKFTRP